MIWDCFLFGGPDDLPMLECRLATLAGTGVHHVLLEARQDFHGQAKPLWFAEHGVTVPGLTAAATWLPGASPHVSTWTREGLQREAFGGVLDGLRAGPDDLVMLSDVDEIPNPRCVGLEGRVLLMRHLAHSLQWRCPGLWPATVCLRYREISSFQRMRDMRHGLPGEPDAGWHLSWMGSPPAKLGTSSHTDYPAAFHAGVQSGSCKRDGWHVLADDVVKMVPADPKTDWPRWIRDGHAPEQWGAHLGAGDGNGGDVLDTGMPWQP